MTVNYPRKGMVKVKTLIYNENVWQLPLVVKQYYHGHYCRMKIITIVKSFIALAYGMKIEIWC